MRLPGIGLFKSSGTFWGLQEGYLLLRAKISFSCFARCWLPGPEFLWGCIFRKELPLGNSWLGMPQEGLGSLCTAHHRDIPAQMVVIQPVLPILVHKKGAVGVGDAPGPARSFLLLLRHLKALGIGAQIRAASEVIFAG